MPVKARPQLDFFDGDLQKILYESEIEFYGPKGGVATDGGIASEYLRGFDRPRVSALIFDVLSGRWGLGDTCVDIGDSLGTDHSAISRGWHWGEFSKELEGFLMAYPGRPDDWEEPIKKVFHGRHRSAFLFVAEFIKQRKPNDAWVTAGALREIHVDLMFDLLEDRSGWMLAKKTGDVRMAVRIVSAVCNDASRDLLPFWYTMQRRREISRLIARLKSDADFAFRYLKLLQSRWERAFVLTWAAVESLGWLDLETD